MRADSPFASWRLLRVFALLLGSIVSIAVALLAASGLVVKHKHEILIAPRRNMSNSNRNHSTTSEWRLRSRLLQVASIKVHMVVMQLTSG